MKRIFGVLVLGVVALTGVAQADPDDGVMGEWKGKTDGGKAVSAKVIGQRDQTYRGVLKAGDWSIPIHGKAHSGLAVLVGGTEDKKVAFTAATQADGSIAGTVHAGGKSMAFSMERQQLESPTLGKKAPAGATIFLGDDGSQAGWTQMPEKWNEMPGGAMRIASGGSMQTKEKMGTGTLHVEFMTPYMPREEGQGRGNSGVYVNGTYEVQVLDSFGDTPADNLCGGIYKIAVPITNASYPPLTWQTYDIDFTAAEFDAQGNKTKNARITVVQNGVTIHDDIELTDRTAGGMSGPEAPTGPLHLQDHSDPVQYRNIWFKAK